MRLVITALLRTPESSEP